MSDATYGELLAMGERFVIEAALHSRDRLPNARAAIAASRGHAGVVRALRANLQIFTRLPSVDGEPREQRISDSASELARALNAFGDTGNTDDLPRVGARPQSSDWADAARAIHAAADMLETHLGPERRQRTPDAVLLDEPAARHAIVRRLAEIALTVGTVAMST